MVKVFRGNTVDYPSEALPSIGLASSLTRTHYTMVKEIRGNTVDYPSETLLSIDLASSLTRKH
jgi:hypothetical protein